MGTPSVTPLDLGLTVFTDVKVTDHSPERASGFERAVADIDEIVGCYIVTGSSDFMVEIAVEDLAAYEEFYLHTLLTLPGVYDSNSKMVMRTMKEPGPLPLRT